LSHINGVQNKRTVGPKCAHFWLTANASNVFHVSQPLYKTWDSLLLRKIIQRFLQCDF